MHLLHKAELVFCRVSPFYTYPDLGFCRVNTYFYSNFEIETLHQPDIDTLHQP